MTLIKFDGYFEGKFEAVKYNLPTTIKSDGLGH